MEKNSRSAMNVSWGTDHGCHVHCQRARPGQSPEERRAPGDWPQADNNRQRVQAASVPNGEGLSAASPSGRLTTSCARGRWLERWRCACLRSGSPR